MPGQVTELQPRYVPRPGIESVALSYGMMLQPTESHWAELDIFLKTNLCS